MQKRPLLPVATAFIIGILLAEAWTLPLFIAIAGLALLCAVLVVTNKYSLAILCVMAALGFIRCQQFCTIAQNDISMFAESETCITTGCITSDVDVRENRAIFNLRVRQVEINGEKIPASGLLLVSCYRPANRPDWQPPNYGDVIVLTARIREPADSNNPGAFSWRDYLARQRIYAEARVYNSEAIAFVKTETLNPVERLALKAKQRVVESVMDNLPPDEAAVVAGIDLGTYAVLPERLLRNFTRTSTLHLLAASGFNCAVVVFVFRFILIKLLRLPRQVANLLLIAILIFYMLMVGAKPSIVRATIMASLLLIAPLVSRPADAINLLFAAALIILMINPLDAFNVSFQLSAAAVLALILVLPIINATAKKWQLDPSSAFGRAKLARYLVRDTWQGFTATIAATLGTIPLLAHYFNQLSLVSFVVNAVVAAMVLPIFVVGLLLPILSWVPLLGDVLVWAGTGVTRFALGVINWFGELPYACVSVPSPRIAGIVGYYLILAAILIYANDKLLSGKNQTRN